MAVNGIPQHFLGNAGGIFGNHFNDLFLVCRVHDVALRLKLGAQIGFGHLGVIFYEISPHDNDAQVGVVTGAAIGNDAHNTFAHIIGNT